MLDEHVLLSMETTAEAEDSQIGHCPSQITRFGSSIGDARRNGAIVFVKARAEQISRPVDLWNTSHKPPNAQLIP